MAAVEHFHKGSCFCGEVEFQLEGKPAEMGWCHCTDCAHWAGAPINAYSLWAPAQLKILKGQDKIGTYAKTPKSFRKFCKSCGGHIYSDHPHIQLVDVYLNCVKGIKHEGKCHLFYGEKTLAVKDGLPKYKDMPQSFGGSGELLPE